MIADGLRLRLSESKLFVRVKMLALRLARPLAQPLIFFLELPLHLVVQVTPLNCPSPHSLIRTLTQRCPSSPWHLPNLPALPRPAIKPVFKRCRWTACAGNEEKDHLGGNIRVRKHQFEVVCYQEIVCFQERSNMPSFKVTTNEDGVQNLVLILHSLNC